MLIGFGDVNLFAVWHELHGSVGLAGCRVLAGGAVVEDVGEVKAEGVDVVRAQIGDLVLEKGLVQSDQLTRGEGEK
eukprot:1169727-Pleurochrysis_carterae.AAC.2